DAPGRGGDHDRARPRGGGLAARIHIWIAAGASGCYAELRELLGPLVASELRAGGQVTIFDPHLDPTGATPASSRGRSSTCSATPWSLHGSHREAGDEAVEEEVVEDGDRHAGDEAGRHQRAPVVDVAADQRDGHPDTDGHLLDGRDERQAVDELLEHE